MFGGTKQNKGRYELENHNFLFSHKLEGSITVLQDAG